MKRFISILLAVALICSAFAVSIVANAADGAVAVPSFVSENPKGLYIHSGNSATDTEAWVTSQAQWDEERGTINKDLEYFFLSSGTSEEMVDIFNGFAFPVTVNSVTIPSKQVAQVPYETGIKYDLYDANSKNKFKTVIFMKSTAEGAIYINNPNADGNGTGLYNYLAYNNDDKSKSAKATGAIVDSRGNVDNTTVKKIKGRGNTTWGKAKKPFNVTYSDNVSIAGMPKSKKFSLLANYQDASLHRNRFLYDLSSAVGIPYASKSRFVDLYMDGIYYGSYQCAQKIEVGSKDVVYDIDDGAYLNEDGTLAENFPFLMEVDAGATYGEDYFTTAASNKLTIKGPELEEGMDYYDEVKKYVADKFTKLSTTVSSKSAKIEQLEEVMDIDSFAKVFLINELGKNWDSGVSSLYMVYKQDENGKWKFFASPVWDYDNSLGNAVGIHSELSDMGVADYESPTGWWCKYKGKRASEKSSTNIMNKIANCTAIQKYAAQVWFDDFIPALRNYNSTNVTEGPLYSQDVYYNYLKGSADMNYTRGWYLDTGGWISDHSKLVKCVYNYEKDELTTIKTIFNYPATFKGEYDYMNDWMNSRAAWLSSQFRADYVEPEYKVGDVDDSGVVDIKDVTEIQRIVLGYTYSENQKKAADINTDGKVDITDATFLQKILAK